MEKIIHFKLPVNKSGAVAISSSSVSDIAKQIKLGLPDEIKVIFTPFEISFNGEIVQFKKEDLEREGITKENVVDMFSRLDSLGIKSELITL